jgi:hypothetical protein
MVTFGCDCNEPIEAVGLAGRTADDRKKYRGFVRSEEKRWRSPAVNRASIHSPSAGKP